jgi:hypothetical protein
MVEFCRLPALIAIVPINYVTIECDDDGDRFVDDSVRGYRNYDNVYLSGQLSLTVVVYQYPYHYLIE